MKESGHKVFRETNTCEEQAAVVLQDLKEGRLSGRNKKKKTEHKVHRWKKRGYVENLEGLETIIKQKNHQAE